MVPRCTLYKLPKGMRYELTDYEWAALRPMLPNKARGVRRVDNRRVLNGICRVLIMDALAAEPADWRARSHCDQLDTHLGQDHDGR